MSEQIVATPQEASGDTSIPKADVFLLNPGNRAFLEGKSHRLGDRILLREMLPFIGLLPLILLGLWAVIQTVKAVSETSRLSQSSAALVTGEIAARRTITGKSTTYYVTYRFRDTGENIYEREQVVSAATYARLGEGSPVSVRYLPTDPTVSGLGGSDTDNTYLVSLTITMIIFIPFLMIMAVLFKNMIRTTRRKIERQRRLVREGRVLPGQVITCDGRTYKGVYTVKVRYRFHSPSDNELIRLATRRRNDLRKAKLAQPGTPAAVLYVNSKLYELL
jgi:Protein of unknown function (DUF3592)